MISGICSLVKDEDSRAVAGKRLYGRSVYFKEGQLKCKEETEGGLPYLNNSYILTINELDQSLPACVPVSVAESISFIYYYHCSAGKKIG